MRLLIILAACALTQARTIEQDCDGIIIRNIKYEQEVIRDGLDSPYQLAIDYDTNTLFFSYSTSDGDEVFKSGYINLKTNVFNNIPGIGGGFANAVDNRRHIVYLGGRDGIYTFNFETEKAERVNGVNHNIWQLFYKDDLYYTSYPDEKAYLYKDGKSSQVSELSHTRAMVLAIDNDSNIYFSNSSGLFLYKKSKGYETSLGDYNVNGFTSDINGNLFFSTPDALYLINSNKKDIEKLTSIENIYGIAIEGDGTIIYASQTGLIRLKPLKVYCYDQEKKNL